MKIAEEKYLVKNGDFFASEEFQTILAQIRSGIEAVVLNSESEFIINPTRMGNGVTPIKDRLIAKLKNEGWEEEVRISVVEGLSRGPIDAILRTSFGVFALEWETGNISSSHRALNKIATGIIQEHLIGGILILPMRRLAKHLTDRIGNYEEIAPYFPMYESLRISDGVIAIFGVEHDGEDINAELIPKGKDGNARLVGRAEVVTRTVESVSATIKD